MAPLSSILFALFTFAGLISKAHGWSVTAVGSAVVIGDEATFKCQMQLENLGDDIASLLVIRTGGVVYLSYSLQGQGTILRNPSKVNSRYSYDVSTSTMKISNVECADELRFECALTVITGTGNVENTSSAGIVVKVAPLVPNPMTTLPDNLTSGVLEKTNVRATCSANTGRPGKGYIQWRIYRNSEDEEILPQGDSRIILSQISLQTGERSCTQRVRSILNIASLEVSDQNLVMACFVVNEDFPIAAANCDSPQTSLCQQSETVRVLYTVRNTQLVGPQTDTVEGSDVTLKCSASSFPTPSYEWSKVGDNRTLESKMNGPVSELVLSKVDINDDSGNYSCTASNTIDGTVHSETKYTSVTIVKPPPTTTPTPTTPEATSTDGGGGTGANKSSSSDGETVIIIVVVVVVVAVIIAIIVFICVMKMRKANKKEPPRPKEMPYYNNKQAMGGPPPDVLGDDRKKPMGGNLNSSFDMKEEGYEDPLKYADLTYDNRPRSRKPMAIGDVSSDYSDVQMPQV